MKQASKLTTLQNTFYSSLRGSQTDLNDLILPIQKMTPKQCVEIYRRGYEARLIEVLGDTFEGCWWVLGDDDFFKLAKKYISQNDSTCFDLSDYGSSFPDFISLQEECSEIPFLKDLGKFEWQFKEIFHAPNVSQLENVWPGTEDEVRTSVFCLSPSHTLFSSSYPIYEIWKQRSNSIDVLNSIEFDSPCFLLIKKFNSQVYVEVLEERLSFAINSFSNELDLTQAIDLLSTAYPDIDAHEIQTIFSKIKSLNALRSKMIR